MLVELTAEEQALWDEIRNYWNVEYKAKGYSHHTDSWDTDDIGGKQRQLMNSLLQRKAIPSHRFEWIKNANYMIGSSKSRWEIFCENFGASDDRVFAHPHWYSMGYLPFLIGVFDLPNHIVEEFREDAKNRYFNDGYMMGQKYRGLAKQNGLQKRHAAEFMKLALDCGYTDSECCTIRDAIYKHLKN